MKRTKNRTLYAKIFVIDNNFLKNETTYISDNGEIVRMED